MRDLKAEAQKRRTINFTNPNARRRFYINTDNIIKLIELSVAKARRFMNGASIEYKTIHGDVFKIARPRRVKKGGA